MPTNETTTRTTSTSMSTANVTFIRVMSVLCKRVRGRVVFTQNECVTLGKYQSVGGSRRVWWYSRCAPQPPKTAGRKSKEG